LSRFYAFNVFLFFIWTFFTSMVLYCANWCAQRCSGNFCVQRSFAIKNDTKVV